ncbi:MAG: hypothetical protein AAF430_12710 [Myxococcota bacterium]
MPRRWAFAVLLVTGLLGATAPATALGPDEAENMVRSTWYEGLPEEEAAQIDADGAAHLATLLADPAEKAIHANVLLALGYSGQPGSAEAVLAYAGNPPSGEVDRDIFRAWQAMPFALGALAESDPRALQRLGAMLDGEEVGWSFRHHTAERIQMQCKRGAVTALSSTGLPAAAAMLQRASEAASDPGLRSHLDDARADLRVRQESAR